MFTPIQLEAIKMFGMKDLSFGCLIFRKEKQHIYQMDSNDLYCDEGEIWRERGNAEPYLLTKDFEILGHIPHLEDLFRVAEKKGITIEIDTGFKNFIYITVNNIQRCISCNFPIPLLDQPNLEEIINLFKNA